MKTFLTRGSIVYTIPAHYGHIFLDKVYREIIFAKYTNGNLFIDRENDMERDIAPLGTGGFTA